jgi:hypothetical protein
VARRLSRGQTRSSSSVGDSGIIDWPSVLGLSSGRP